MTTVHQLRRNIYSQNGEDGILEYAITKLPRDNWCCEFGAYDGTTLSNTYNLVQNHRYRAVYLESDDAKFEKLLITANNHPSILPLHRMVGVAEQDALDEILSGTAIPQHFDILSIDVDGLDYLIWKSVTRYEPKIVILEINSSLPPTTSMDEEQVSFARLSHLARVESPEAGVNFETAYRLGRQKGYRLLAHTGNMIFIHEKFASNFPEVADDSNFLSYFDRSWQRG